MNFEKTIKSEYDKYMSESYSEEDIKVCLGEEKYVDILTSSKCPCPLVKVKNEAMALFKVLKNKEKFPKVILTMAISVLLYIICPIDLIPDTVPVLGLLDDVAFLQRAFIETKFIYQWKEV